MKLDLILIDRLRSDWVDYSVLCVIVLWLVMVSISCFYDSRNRVKFSDHLHYVTAYKQTGEYRITTKLKLAVILLFDRQNNSDSVFIKTQLVSIDC